MNLECWEIEEAKHIFQIQGFDGVLGGDVRDNFNVSVTFNTGTTILLIIFVLLKLLLWVEEI